MKRAITPFNISLLTVTRTESLLLKPITTLDMYEGNTGQFHSEGIFSTEIFGRVGSKKRSTEFARIPLKMTILHPVIFKNYCKLKSLYKKIMEGTEYAIYDKKTNDFIKADPGTGRTGFDFFISHAHTLAPPKTTSGGRNNRITTIDKYRNEAVQNNILVYPAGLRDVFADEDGRTKMDDVNTLYQRVIAINNTLPDKFYAAEEREMYDRARLQLQTAFNDIYDYFTTLISGKHGFIQKAFASRRLFDGTRGVITSLDVTCANLASNKRPKFMDAVAGMFQVAKAILPKTKYYLANSVLKDVFDTRSDVVELINKDTLKKEEVKITGKTLDQWYSPLGFERIVSSLRTVERRAKPVIIEGHYLALIFNNGKYFRIFRDIDELPEEYDRKYVRPLSYIELVYYSGYKEWNKHKAVITRYPVTGIGSVIPAGVYVKTTDVGIMANELDDQWRPIEGAIALEGPKLDGEKLYYHDTISMPPSYLSPLGADFDGDTISFNMVYLEESIKEITKLLQSRRHYINAEGRLAFTVNVRTIDLALRNLSGPPRKPKGAK